MSVARSPRVLWLGLEIDSCQQRVMVRTEDAGSAILGVFVQPVNSSCNNDAAAITHKDVVQDQSRQRMEGVTPGWNRGWNPEGKPRFLEQPPGGLISAATEIEVRAQYRCVIPHLFEQVPCLLSPAACSEPPVARRSTRIEMGTDQAQTAGPQRDGRCDRHTALQHERKLKGVSILQRERRQNGISPVARRRAVPHGRSVSQVQSEGSSRLHDILLFAEPCNQHSADSSFLQGLNRGVAPVRLLYHYDKRQARIRSQSSVVTVPDPPYDSAELAPSDPEVPAQDDDATR